MELHCAEGFRDSSLLSSPEGVGKEASAQHCTSGSLDCTREGCCPGPQAQYSLGVPTGPQRHSSFVFWVESPQKCSLPTQEAPEGLAAERKGWLAYCRFCKMMSPATCSQAFWSRVFPELPAHSWRPFGHLDCCGWPQIVMCVHGDTHSACPLEPWSLITTCALTL